MNGFHEIGEAELIEVLVKFLDTEIDAVQKSTIMKVKKIKE